MNVFYGDVVVVGSGVAGLTCALELSKEFDNIVLITKKFLEDSNSYLAQGGMAVMKSVEDRKVFLEDTLKAGHYKNNKRAVEILIDESQDAIRTLVGYGAKFQREKGEYSYTREGGHSVNRILYCGDYTGRAIMEALIEKVKACSKIKILEKYTMEDLLIHNKVCYGIYARGRENILIRGKKTVLATGGIGGIYKNSTNYSHIRGDGIALAIRHKVGLKDISYVQIHPTALYEEGDKRKFLISESLRGEGAIILNHKKERFTYELNPRDIVSQAIIREMKKEEVSHQWLRLSNIKVDIEKRFPKIYEQLKSMAIDPYNEDVPIVPAQHYTMGGIEVDLFGRTSMLGLYAVGEVACTGVHGENRLASNSLLESVVYAKRVAKSIANSRYVKEYKGNFKINNLDSYRNSEVIGEVIKIDKLAKIK